MDGEGDRIEAAEARVTALAALMRCALTALVLRGVLNKAAIDELLKESAEVLQAHGAHPAAIEELKSLGGDLPDYLRAAMGPGPDPDFEDH